MECFCLNIGRQMDVPPSHLPSVRTQHAMGLHEPAGLPALGAAGFSMTSFWREASMTCPQALLGQAARCGPWTPGKLVLRAPDRQICPLNEAGHCEGAGTACCLVTCRALDSIPLLHVLVSSLCYMGANGTHAKGGCCVLGCQHRSPWSLTPESCLLPASRKQEQGSQSESELGEVSVFHTCGQTVPLRGAMGAPLRWRGSTG